MEEMTEGDGTEHPPVPPTLDLTDPIFTKHRTFPMKEPTEWTTARNRIRNSNQNLPQRLHLYSVHGRESGGPDQISSLLFPLQLDEESVIGVELPVYGSKVGTAKLLYEGVITVSPTDLRRLTRIMACYFNGDAVPRDFPFYTCRHINSLVHPVFSSMESREKKFSDRCLVSVRDFMVAKDLNRTLLANLVDTASLHRAIVRFSMGDGRALANDADCDECVGDSELEVPVAGAAFGMGFQRGRCCASAIPQIVRNGENCLLLLFAQSLITDVPRSLVWCRDVLKDAYLLPSVLLDTISGTDGHPTQAWR